MSSERDSPNSSPLHSNVNKSKFEISDNDEEEIDYTYLTRMRARLVRQDRTLPPKTTLWVLTLLIFGSVFIVLGVLEIVKSIFGAKVDEGVGIGMLVLGTLMFLPGSYGTLVVYGAYRRWDGWSYDQIPSYDD